MRVELRDVIPAVFGRLALESFSRKLSVVKCYELIVEKKRNAIVNVCDLFFLYCGSIT